MSDTAGRVGGNIETAVPGPRADSDLSGQADGQSAGAAPRFHPGQRVELAVQVGSWVEGTPCTIVDQEQRYSPYEWRVTVHRDAGDLDASVYEHELRPAPSRLEKLCARVDNSWLEGYTSWAEKMTPIVDPTWPETLHYRNDGEDPFGAAVDALYADAQELLLRKHADYGPLNISRAPGGALNGLRVRLWDKLARINHLLDSGAEPQNESLRDSWIDMMNYSAIALLYLDGSWPE